MGQYNSNYLLFCPAILILVLMNLSNDKKNIYLFLLLLFFFIPKVIYNNQVSEFNLMQFIYYFTNDFN